MGAYYSTGLGDVSRPSTDFVFPCSIALIYSDMLNEPFSKKGPADYLLGASYLTLLNLHITE